MKRIIILIVSHLTVAVIVGAIALICGVLAITKRNNVINEQEELIQQKDEQLVALTEQLIAQQLKRHARDYHVRQEQKSPTPEAQQSDQDDPDGSN